MVSQSSIFLRLPLEIREKIYLQLLLFRDDVGVQSLTPKLDRWIKSMWDDSGSTFCGDEDDIVPRGRTSILYVSKQISDEALDVLYQRNTFVIHTHADSHDKFLKFGTVNIRRIRSLRLVTHPQELGYMEPVNFDPKIWDPLLTDLTHLSLVLQQPWKARGHYDSSGSKDKFQNCIDEELQRWLVWLEPILQYFASNISERTTVSIDDNELAETSEVVHKCFRAGYQKVQTEIGDRIFERALPSEDDDYWYDDYDMDSTCGGTINDWSD
ncbi:hypothetical protein F4813DRAFT_371333 [Daldinia decipiens]|uniref:uncharacterized protein n=1 Tax=Daldinia decipiens TaxID=326647 RepID=UPI0020C21C19|nr:uncharacterized protein F4813DRAFT_371333 [Daldinia decipiens]KAI1654303.1 hypothetical protein F4813DRAFT_371333 [Daldinia decipiens]